MKLKKALSVVFALTLVFALAVPVFASAMDHTFTATTTIPDDAGTVSVGIQANTTNGNHLYLNTTGTPYQLADNTVSGITIKEGTATEGFFTNTGLIKNDGKTVLSVKVAITSTVSGAEIIAPSSSRIGDVTANTLAGNLEVVAVTASNNTVTPVWTGAQKIEIPAADDQTNGGVTAGSATAITADLAAAAQVTSGGRQVTIPGLLAFRLAGDIKLLSTGWGSDTASVKVAFTFTPKTTGAGG